MHKKHIAPLCRQTKFHMQNKKIAEIEPVFLSKKTPSPYFAHIKNFVWQVYDNILNVIFQGNFCKKKSEQAIFCLFRRGLLKTV